MHQYDRALEVAQKITLKSLKKLGVSLPHTHQYPLTPDDVRCLLEHGKELRD